MNKSEFEHVAEPDLITGDMDSLPADILDQFRESTTHIVFTPDQDETDYVKALREMRKFCELENIQVRNI